MTLLLFCFCPPQYSTCEWLSFMLCVFLVVSVFLQLGSTFTIVCFCFVDYLCWQWRCSVFLAPCSNNTLSVLNTKWNIIRRITNKSVSEMRHFTCSERWLVRPGRTALSSCAPGQRNQWILRRTWELLVQASQWTGTDARSSTDRPRITSVCVSAPLRTIYRKHLRRRHELVSTLYKSNNDR